MNSLKLCGLEGIPIIRQGDDLAEIILTALHRSKIVLQDGDILVVTQKIISKAEGRLINLTDIHPAASSRRMAKRCNKDPRLVEIILQESNSVLRVRPGILIVEHRLGFVCANAGIDHSNIQDRPGTTQEWVSLLPKDPDASARNLRQTLQSRTKTELGVLIIDSHGRAWRNGTSGVAIGLSGLPGLEDLRGKPDLFDRKLQITTGDRYSVSQIAFGVTF